MAQDSPARARHPARRRPWLAPAGERYIALLLAGLLAVILLARAACQAG